MSVSAFDHPCSQVLWASSARKAAGGAIGGVTVGEATLKNGEEISISRKQGFVRS